MSDFQENFDAQMAKVVETEATDELRENIEKVIRTAKELERLRIARWLLDRAGMIERNGAPEVGYELVTAARAIKGNAMGEKGMIA